jgi:hypothetical protein
MAPVVLSSEFKFFGVILLKLSVEVIQYLWIFNIFWHLRISKVAGTL